VQLKDFLKDKRCGKFIEWVLILHDNAPAHWALATQKKLAYLGFPFFDHPPYSPDLAQSEYHLFRVAGFSLQHGYHSNPTTPTLQHTSNQKQYDQCGNSTEQ